VPPLTVAALGGNAIARASERGTAAEQRRNLRKAASSLADIVAGGSRLVVTHGNGPQVGALLIQAERGAAEVPPPPLDILVAKTQGWLGYLVAEALDREFARRGLEERCAPMLMRVLVDAKDPAFKDPSKPVGPHFAPEAGKRAAAERGWAMKPVAVASGKPTWRRVVASPRPLKLVDLEAVRAVLARGLVPVTVGGGGVPVAVRDGALVGVEGVIDKDVASGLLAAELRADRLLILTDVDKVSSHFGRKDQADIDLMTVSEARQWIAEREFPPGSMRTKVEGAILYLERGGKEATICHLDAVKRALAGRAGTRIVPDRRPGPSVAARLGK
jgi:carbamate kinase